MDLTFISLWQKPLRWSRNSTRLSYEKNKYHFSESSQQCTQKNLVKWWGQLLLVTDKNICYFFFTWARQNLNQRVLSSWFSCSFLMEFNFMELCKTIDDFTPTLVQNDERPWQFFCPRINTYVLWPLPVKYRIPHSFHHGFQWIICLTWRFEQTYQTPQLGKIPNNSRAKMVFSKICHVFANDCMSINLTFTACLESTSWLATFVGNICRHNLLGGCRQLM